MKKCPTCKRQFPDEMRTCPRDKISLYQVRTVYEGAVIQEEYRVESVLGVGGMSTVFLVEQLIFHEKMAMKVMSLDCARDKGFRQRFENEARIMRRLQSNFGRNIVRVEDVGETEDGLPFVVMEYVAGEPLSRLICPDESPESRRPLEIAHALKIAVQLCDALEVAHGQNIVHRDIKPENVLLTEEDGTEVVKVLDFGIAKFDYADSPSIDRGPVQGEYAGSPHYSSPEQAAGKGQHIDGRSDLYSLGVVLYEMLTGQQPFTGASNQNILSKHRHMPPEPPDTLNPLLSVSLVDLTLKALAKAPADRFQTASEMRASLEFELQVMGDPAVRLTGPEYALSIASEEGEVEFNVAIGHGETLSSVLDELITELGGRGVRLKYHQSGGSVRVTSNGRELEHAVPLRRQGVHPGDELRICSVHVQQRDELQQWIHENEAPEKLLELAREALQSCRERYRELLQLDPALDSALSGLDEKCRDLLAVKETMQKEGAVAGLAAAEKLLQANAEFEAAAVLKAGAIQDLSGQVTSLLDEQQFEDASRLLSDIQTATGSRESFAALAVRQQTESATVEARIQEATECVAQGDFERGRSILQSFRQETQLRSGLLLPRILGELDSTPAWVQRVSRLVAEEQWQQAKTALEERTSLFQVWPPFLPMASALNAVELVSKRLQSNETAEQPRLLFSVLAESGMLDLRWAGIVGFDAALPASLVGLAQQILSKIGLLIGSAEKRRHAAEESNLRRSFIAGLRELATRDLQQARQRLDRAMASDPDPQLETLRGELEYV